MTSSMLPTQAVGSCTVFDDTVEVLAGFRPGYPKFYSIADLGTQSRRRWVPLDRAVDSGRVETMFRDYFAESGDIRFSTYLVADAFAHGVIGRAVASFVTIGRVWDTGAENLAVRTDIEGGLDWAGVRDTTLRVLGDDPKAGCPGTVVLPCEQALAQWLACRSRMTLGPVFDGLARVSNCSVETLWSVVGECVLGAATIVPTFADSSAETGYRRGQFVLQALHDSGLAVRKRSALPRTPGAGPIPVRDRGWRSVR
ncbi:MULTISPECIES: hypothetical protein [unclassified Dietzia]|uniref:hypothetical protein n=1 Tax=unclassified Dietzia TaxID=2617939 RepID=UPI000D2169C5|nr:MULTISPECIES: hypothetical protein [unclassified Dietzia]AVZ39367.1 hypothetical protein CT688_07675 [Dietzia sp. JS16-p6b]MBB1025371.1 hypothetical protein [Dietzia sp. DQ12-76]MBB1026575.1 hypothetical protein [Dietzia sp. DQ11-38-2]QGW24628.1 hypothetical protein GJR88_02453 [Dietzia sp. DQ12-45-1b]